MSKGGLPSVNIMRGAREFHTPRFKKVSGYLESLPVVTGRLVFRPAQAQPRGLTRDHDFGR